MRLAEQHPNIFNVGLTGIDEDTPAIERIGKKHVINKYKKFLAKFDNFAAVLPRHKYVISVDGVAASWRGRELFAAGSVVLLQQGIWQEHFFADLEPFVHFV